MDPNFYQKHIYIGYHLKALIKEWNRVKPFYEAQLNTDSPSFVLGGLHSLGKRMSRAYGKLYHLNTYKDRIEKTCFPNPIPREIMREISNSTAFSYEKLSEIDTLLEKFKSGKTIPLRALPYEYQSRLVELLSVPDLATFKLAGGEVTNFVQQRKVINSRLMVVKNGTTVRHAGYKIMTESDFLKSDSHYISNRLHVNLDSVDNFKQVADRVSGCYYDLVLRGHYHWTTAIQLMNASKESETVRLMGQMHLELHDFVEFYKAIIQWLKQKEEEVFIEISRQGLDEFFEPCLEEWIEAYNKYFKVYRAQNDLTLVCMKPVL